MGFRLRRHARHSVSVAAAIVDDEGKLLVIQRRDNRRWQPPGGVLEVHETIEDGLRREVREETGLEVKPVALTGTYKNMTRGVIALVFRCYVIGGQAEQTTNETLALRWMEPDEIRRHLDEAYAVRLLDALGAGTSAFRIHNGHELIMS
jgi:8-oxo-dGTP pyrophosphatase MutT (NUDIX family)